MFQTFTESSPIRGTCTQASGFRRPQSFPGAQPADPRGCTHTPTPAPSLGGCCVLAQRRPGSDPEAPPGARPPRDLGSGLLEEVGDPRRQLSGVQPLPCPGFEAPRGEGRGPVQGRGSTRQQVPAPHPTSGSTGLQEATGLRTLGPNGQTVRS